MASNSESGHAVNISNFKLLIDRCTGFGAQYVPGNDAISVAKMTTQWTGADDSQTTIRTAEQNSKQPINARVILNEPLNSLVTQVLNVLKGTKASKQVIQDAKTLADSIRGFNAKKPKAKDDENITEWVSQSQQSYVQKAEHFSALIELLKTIPEYKPTEAKFKTDSLDAYYHQLKDANDGIGAVLTMVITARIARNRALYDADLGMLDTAQKSKDYVKGAFKANSAEYKSVRGIRFRKNNDGSI